MVLEINRDYLRDAKVRPIRPFENLYEYIIMDVEKILSKGRSVKQIYDFDEDSSKVVAFDLTLRQSPMFHEFLFEYNLTLTQADKKMALAVIDSDSTDFRKYEIDLNKGPFMNVYIDDKSRQAGMAAQSDYTKPSKWRDNRIWSAINDDSEYLFETMYGALYVPEENAAQLKFLFDMRTYRLMLDLQVKKVKSSTILPKTKSLRKFGFSAYEQSKKNMMVVGYYNDVFDLLSKFQARFGVFMIDKLIQWVTPRLYVLVAGKYRVDFEDEHHFVHDYYEYLEKFASPELFNSLFDSSISNFKFNQLFFEEITEDYSKFKREFKARLDSWQDSYDIYLVNSQIQGPRKFSTGLLTNGIHEFCLDDDNFQHRTYKFFIDDGIDENVVGKDSVIVHASDDKISSHQNTLLIIPDLILGFIGQSMILIESETANSWIDFESTNTKLLDFCYDGNDVSVNKMFDYFDDVVIESLRGFYSSTTVSQMEKFLSLFTLWRGNGYETLHYLNLFHKSVSPYMYFSYESDLLSKSSLDNA